MSDTEASAGSPRSTMRAEDLPRGVERSLTADDRRRLREEYGQVRAAFRSRPERFRGLQRSLDQARVGLTYDQYMTRGVRYGAVGALTAAVVAALFALVAVATGVFTGIPSPVPLTGVVREILTSREIVTPIAAALGLGAATFGTVVAVWYYYPSFVITSRRQSIDIMLPHAVVYAYALSYGGMNLLEVIDRLSDAEDSYGTVAKEFDAIRRDVELFGTDLYTALRNARNLTPSDNFTQFLDDLLGVMESGGDPTEFFAEQSSVYLRRAQEEQEDFLETLGILSEIFVVAFVAAPLFLVVILLVISILGGQTLGTLLLIVYAVIPLGMALYVTLIATVSEPFTYQIKELPSRAERRTAQRTAAAEERLAADERYEAYQAQKAKRRRRALLRNPLELMRRQPLYTLVVTIPVALAAVGAVLALGLADPAAFTEAPVATTNWLLVLPFFVVAVPLGVFYEYERGRADEVARRFPDMLDVLSSANRMGVSLPEAFGVVARWTGGGFAAELTRVKNDMRWQADPSAALRAYANRVRVPQVSRTLKLIAEGISSTGDLSHVLEIAANDTRNRYRMVRARSRELTAYVAVVIIGYLVYLLVVVLLDAFYLVPIEQVAGESSATGPGLPRSLTAVPVDTYRMVFYHSALIQGIGSGLLTGQLADGDVRSGLKYAVGLAAVAFLAFQLV
jgi:flagellar protein FlaJ